MWDSFFLPSNLQASLQDEQILENEREYKSYIATILASLNNLAKYKEAMHEIQVVLKTFDNKLNSWNAEKTIRDYFAAKSKLLEVKNFLIKCTTYINDGLQQHNLNLIYTASHNAKDYIYSVMAYLPKEGKTGTENLNIYNQLKSCYENAISAREKVLQYLENQDYSKASNANPTKWTANQVGFNLDIEALRSQIQDEFFKNGNIDNVNLKISNAYSDLLEQYEKIEDSVKEEYSNLKESGNYSGDIDKEYEEFLKQLNAYKDIDQINYSELLNDVNSLLSKLKFQTKINQYCYNVLRYSINSLKNEINFIIQKWPTDFPSSNYLGIGKFTPPVASFNSLIKTPYYLTDTFSYINDNLKTVSTELESLSRNIENLNTINKIAININYQDIQKKLLLKQDKSSKNSPT